MRLEAVFYNRDTVTVARDLLGKVLIKGNLAGIIIETEAYRAADDPACHGFSGNKGRGAQLFKPAGSSYVYFIYGMYHCFNVVTEAEGVGGAVLIRAIVPLSGLDTMKANRGTDSEKTLANGPGKLCLAMDITREHNDLDLTTNPDLYIEDRAVNVPDQFINRTKRIGISKAKDLPWRFVVGQDGLKNI